MFDTDIDEYQDSVFTCRMVLYCCIPEKGLDRDVWVKEVEVFICLLACLFYFFKKKIHLQGRK